ncbi:MAG TPA: PilZ domain-containing protein [Pyrinomonadaceae bacterium]|nr:PilZ domain-containing protein [Pyrinomonadaceae bacterium]
MLSSPANVEKNSRRIGRVSLTLPVRIEAHVNQTVSWNEITRLSDVSAFGAGFNLNHPLKRGRLVQMTIPLPRKLRCYDFTESQYKVWGLVRSCVSKSNSAAASENHSVGVAFIGRNPPKSFFDDPAKLYEISHRNDGQLWHIVEAPDNPDERHLPKQLRRHTRFPLPTTIIIETLDEEGRATASENTVTENISLSGAAVFSMLNVEKGSFVRVKSEQYNTSIISVVRGKHLGSDHIPRLHLEFIDRFFPLEGIE